MQTIKKSLAETTAYGLLSRLPESWVRAGKLEARVRQALLSGDGDELNLTAAESLVAAVCEEYSALPGQPKIGANIAADSTSSDRRSCYTPEDLIMEADLSTSAGNAALDRAVAEADRTRELLEGSNPALDGLLDGLSNYKKDLKR